MYFPPAPWFRSWGSFVKPGGQPMFELSPATSFRSSIHSVGTYDLSVPPLRPPRTDRCFLQRRPFGAQRTPCCEWCRPARAVRDAPQAAVTASNEIAAATMTIRREAPRLGDRRPSRFQGLKSIGAFYFGASCSKPCARGQQVDEFRARVFRTSRGAASPDESLWDSEPGLIRRG